MRVNGSTTASDGLTALWRRASGLSSGDTKLTDPFGPGERVLTRTVATLTTPLAVAREVQETEEILHHWSHPNNTSTEHILTHPLELAAGLADAEELLKDLRDAFELEWRDERRTTSERLYVQSLMHVLVTALARWALAKGQKLEDHPLDRSKISSLGELRVWLLELVVRQYVGSRVLAFTVLVVLDTVVSTLLLQSGVRGNARIIKLLQQELFSLFLDMLTKAIMTSTAMSGANTHDENDELGWIRTAVTCLVLFTRQGGCQQERLQGLDPHLLVFLIRHSSGLIDDHEMNEALLPIAISAMYLQHGQNGRGHLRKPTGFAPPTDMSSCHPHALSSTDLERFGGHEFFLFHFYTTPSDSLRRMLLVVFYDVTMEQLRKHNGLGTTDSWASFDTILQLFQRCNFVDRFVSAPQVFIGSSGIKFAKKLHAAVENELLEKHVQVFFQLLRTTLQLEEYFGRSAALSSAISVLATNQQQHVAAALIQRVKSLLASLRDEERFKGERWLAELMAYGIEIAPTTTNTDLLNNDTDLLEPSYILAGGEPDLSPPYENSEIRQAARTLYWELLRATSSASRLTAVRTLRLFTHRMRSGLRDGGRIVREIDRSLRILVAQNEDDIGVVTTVMYMIVDLCSTVVPYLDARKLQYDQAATGQSERPGLASAESLPSRILSGDVAVDRTLLTSIPLEFLLHAAALLDSALNPAHACRGGCCGIITSALGDLLATTTLLITYSAEDPQWCNRIGGIVSLTPYLDSCDSRVAVLMAKFLRGKLKQLNGADRYGDILREFHAIAVEEDDETLLANDFAHVRALLHRLHRP
ncbi:hypothetical protein Poli38472_009874 [Pythium oligandrum]|uniref:Uncharacterized protein n=1 Tax=Pythium oligandrum TaxID=41045 RepID=A0A8K1CGH2_PYTOL|nr:hypothetical protein Poli38472_009874 [Pythium oligandrum]|eukprot:TMW62381.1 hypothetical protein Poli38472_009874 [Pythium oligandrum]